MSSTGFISGTPTRAESVPVTATVSDGVLTTTRSFTWSVNPPLTLVSLTADRVAPQPAGTAITFTATAAGGTSPYQYRWWVHDGTSWQMLRDWTTSPTFTWTPTTANAAYRINVWVKNGDSITSTFDADGSMAFPIVPPLQVALTADRPAPQATGTTVTLTVSTTGGKSPFQYRWWVHDGTSWQLLRDWTTSPTFKWTPASANAAYRITAWVKNADSTTATWDADVSMPFPIQ